MTRFRKPAALIAALASVVAISACGDSVPGDSVVRVGDSTITKSTFDHWLRVAAISSAGQTDPTAAAEGRVPKVTIPDPPDFTKCVADKKKNAPKPAKGQPTPTDDQYKQQCKTEYEGLRDQVLQFLISAFWIESEAKDQGVKVSDQDVLKQFKTTRKQSFPNDADFQRFLKSSGMTIEDLLFRVKLDTLSNKIRAKVTKDSQKVTPTEIQNYYNKNKSRFAQPERRDLRIVLTKTAAQAQAAKKAIQSGQPFGAVAKKYSIDQASKAQGGVLLAVAKGQQEKAFDDAIFKAKKGVLTGPVKTQFGYYVFKVQKITAANQQSLKDATPTIKQLLSSQGQQTALDDFVKNFRKKWKGKTNCRSGYRTQDCKNAPKVSTNTTQGGGQTPTPTPTPVPGNTTGG